MPFVSRAGLKLEHALSTFGLAVEGLSCADFGCNVGGFTDCLLQHDAARVYAVDTSYGVLAYKLRADRRVVVMERTNALHAEVPEPVDLVVVDVGWTPQRLIVPAALRWLKPTGHLICLVKPQYELSAEERGGLLRDGRLDPQDAATVLERVLSTLPMMGAEPVAHCRSPLTGRKSSRGGRGNVEFLVLIRPARNKSGAS